MRVNRWRLARRLVQLTVVLLLASPALGLSLFQGNLASASLAGLRLSDPLAALQVLLLTGGLALSLAAGVGLVLLFYLLVGGRTFCGWVCPVHLLTDLAERLPGSRHRPRWQPGWKWVSLGVALLLTLALRIPAFETLSPIGIVGRALSFGPGPELVLVGLLVAAELLLVRRLWCRSLCPLGALYAALGRISPLRVVYDAERCVHCGRCRQECFVPEVLAPPLEQGAAAVVSGECSRCGSCVGACPVGALSLRYRHPLR